MSQSPQSNAAHGFAWRFGLRSLLIFVTVIAIALAAVGNGIRDRRARLAAIERLRAHGMSTHATYTFKATRWQRFIAWVSGDPKTERAFAILISSTELGRDRVPYAPGTLTDTDVADLHRFPELNDLRFNAGHRLTSSGREQIAKLPNLRRIVLTEQSLDFLLGRELERSTSLDELWLEDATVPPEILAALSRLPNLRRLDLFQCRTSQGALADAKLPRLEEFSLMDCELTDDDFAAMGKIASLQVISCQASGMKGDVYRHFTNLLYLRELHTFGQPIDDSSADHVPKMQALEFLSIGQTNITPERISRLLKECPNLVITCDSQEKELPADDRTEISRRFGEFFERIRIKDMGGTE